VFAGAARAPITAVIIMFELTGEYSIILPLMFAIVLAAGVSNQLSPDTIYTLKLRRRGIDILQGRRANVMELLRVSEAMQPVPNGINLDASLNEIVTRFTVDARDALPVVDAQGAYRGTVVAQQVEDAMRSNELDATAAELAIETPTVHTDQNLEDVLRLVVHHDAAGGLPVMSTENPERMVGWITERDVLRAYSQHLERSVEQAEGGNTVPVRAQAPLPSAAGRLARLHGYRVVDLLIPEHAQAARRRVGDLVWPRSALLMAIRRGAEAIEPTNETELRPGDHLTVLAPAGQIETLTSSLGFAVEDPRPEEKP
jgi:chloride channel protein, CIC family